MSHTKKEERTESTSRPDSKSKSKRKWDAWSEAEVEGFFRCMNLYGVREFSKTAQALGSKTREQVRHYYYRLLKKINACLVPFGVTVNKQDRDEVRKALVCWYNFKKDEGSLTAAPTKDASSSRSLASALHRSITSTSSANDDSNDASPATTTEEDDESNFNNHYSHSSKSSPVSSSPPSSSPPSSPLNHTRSGNHNNNTKTNTTLKNNNNTNYSNNSSKKNTNNNNKLNNSIGNSSNQISNNSGDDETVSNSSTPLNLSTSSGTNSLETSSTCLPGSLEEQELLIQQQYQQNQITNAIANKIIVDSNQFDSNSNTNLNNSLNPNTSPSESSSLVEASSPSSNLLSLSNSVPYSPSLIPPTRLTLQLLPKQRSISESLIRHGYNPFIQLNFSYKKPLSKIIQYLSTRWVIPPFQTPIPVHPIRFYPPAAPFHPGFGIEHSSMTAGDLFIKLGSPPVMQVLYSWLDDSSLDEDEGSNPNHDDSNLKMQLPCNRKRTWGIMMGGNDDEDNTSNTNSNSNNSSNSSSNNGEWMMEKRQKYIDTINRVARPSLTESNPITWGEEQNHNTNNNNNNNNSDNNNNSSNNYGNFNLNNYLVGQ